MFNLPILLLGLTLTGLAASLACASSPPTGPVRPQLARATASADVHPSIDEAVAAAFEASERTAGPRERDRLRIGTVRQVAGGFVWTEPISSETPIGAISPMRVRLRLGPQDVAIYGVHPRSGLADVDRSNEAVSRSERRLVDELDPLHRPFYVRTPSRRTLRYPDLPESVEIVRREGVPRR